MSAANQYLLRAPFSLEKITWNESTRCVIYRSRRNWRTKQNFQVFTATDFLAAAVEHIPPKHQQTVRYYGLYSNKYRGMDRIFPQAPTGTGSTRHATPATTVPPPPVASARALRPLWRDLIIRVWGEDPLLCPCCKALMRVAGTLQRPEEIEFFLRLYGLWEPVIDIPPPPEPPYDVEKRRGIGGVLDAGEAGARRESPPTGRANQTMDPLEPAWRAPERALDEERILILDAEDPPQDE